MPGREVRYGEAVLRQTVSIPRGTGPSGPRLIQAALLRIAEGHAPALSHSASPRLGDAWYNQESVGAQHLNHGLLQ